MNKLDQTEAPAKISVLPFPGVLEYGRPDIQLIAIGKFKGVDQSMIPVFPVIFGYCVLSSGFLGLTDSFYLQIGYAVLDKFCT